MVRAILAAVAAYLGIGALVVFTDQILSLLTHSAASPPTGYFVTSVVTDSFHSLLGGYICAAIGKQSARLATRILLVGGELIGIGAVIAYWRSMPHWFALALLVVFPVCVASGSQLHRQREAAAI